MYHYCCRAGKTHRNWTGLLEGLIYTLCEMCVFVCRNAALRKPENGISLEILAFLERKMRV